jgi:hypothetical protein
MTDDTVIHFVADGLTFLVPAPGFSGGRVAAYGDELTVTAEIRELNTDRLGHCFLDLDEDGQRQRYGGRVMFRSGPWPEGEARIEVGSQAWFAERETRRAEAWAIEDEADRAARLALIDANYGRPATSRTLAHYRGPDDRSIA